MADDPKVPKREWELSERDRLLLMKHQTRVEEILQEQAEYQRLQQQVNKKR